MPAAVCVKSLKHPAKRAQYSVKRALHFVKTAWYSVKIALLPWCYEMSACQQSPVFNHKSFPAFLFTEHRALLTGNLQNIGLFWQEIFCDRIQGSVDRALYFLSKEPYVLSKKSTFCQQNPVFCQESSMFCQKSPRFCQRAFSIDTSSHVCAKRALNLSKEPYIPSKEFYVPSNEPAKRALSLHSVKRALWSSNLSRLSLVSAPHFCVLSLSLPSSSLHRFLSLVASCTPCHSVNRAIYSVKRAMYFVKRAPHSVKKAFLGSLYLTHTIPLRPSLLSHVYKYERAGVYWIAYHDLFMCATQCIHTCEMWRMYMCIMYRRYIILYIVLVTYVDVTYVYVYYISYVSCICVLYIIYVLIYDIVYMCIIHIHTSRGRYIISYIVHIHDIIY